MLPELPPMLITDANHSDHSGTWLTEQLPQRMRVLGFQSSSSWMRWRDPSVAA
jgi:hypothetical protein